jgi:hypothetical protein
MRMSRLDPLLSDGIRKSVRETQVVVLAVAQAPGQPVMLFGGIIAARGGFGDADLDRAAEEPDLRGEGRGIDLIAAGIDGLGHQVLHRD